MGLSLAASAFFDSPDRSATYETIDGRLKF